MSKRLTDTDRAIESINMQIDVLMRARLALEQARDGRSASRPEQPARTPRRARHRSGSNQPDPLDGQTGSTTANVGTGSLTGV